MHWLSLRPIPVSLSQDYINILERDIVDINRALTNNYWFDDKENNIANVWEEHDYEIISTSKKIFIEILLLYFML